MWSFRVNNNSVYGTTTQVYKCLFQNTEDENYAYFPACNGENDVLFLQFEEKVLN